MYNRFNIANAVRSGKICAVIGALNDSWLEILLLGRWFWLVQWLVVLVFVLVFGCCWFKFSSVGRERDRHVQLGG